MCAFTARHETYILSGIMNRKKRCYDGKNLFIRKTNKFCPQTLFVYGTYKEDGTPNFGLFCWFSYCWDGEMHVMACIGGEKLTKDRIRAQGVFSANLVTENILPLADYFGNNEGYITEKGTVAAVASGAKLPVPVLVDSPWTFELRVTRTIPMDDGDVFICKIENILAAAHLMDETVPFEQRLQQCAPVVRAASQGYFSHTGKFLGMWGEPQAQLKG